MRKQLSTIGLLFKNTVSFTPSNDVLRTVLQSYVSSYISPAWGVSCSLSVVTEPTKAVDGLLIFADDTNQAGALGYHDLEGGQPIGYVFVRTSETDGDPVSVVASHELAEMLIDPDADQVVRDAYAGFVAKEICDPVESNTFEISGVPVSNFVTRNWFGGPGKPYDFLNVLTQPYQIASGGYAIVWSPGKGWQSVYGLRAKPKPPGTYRRLELRRAK